MIFLALSSMERLQTTQIILQKNIHVQKYILATSDFAKGMQTNINNYMTSHRITNVSFRQKLDPRKKNILRRQNPLELVFEDISTFDAEKPIIVGSLLRELSRGKKLTAGDLAGVDFAIRNRLNKLKKRKNNTSSPTPTPPPPFLPPPPPLSSFAFSLPSPPPPPTKHIFSPLLPLPPPSSSFHFPTQTDFHQISCLALKHKH